MTVPLARDFSAVTVVTFDCDGVMFDSSRANRAYYDDVLQHIGLPAMTAEQFNYAHMHTVDETLNYLIDDPRKLEIAHHYRRRRSYLPFIRHMVPEPGLTSVLPKLRTRYQTAIATNRTDTMEHVLIEHGLEGQFDLVVTALDVQMPKPHPEPLLAVLTHFAIAPRQMVYIGDSLLDAQASQAAGVPFIAYQNRDLSADLHIEALSQIPPILGLA
jgi:HAD superfamily hydrolase (TIGR01509 family)